jgi:hypothetical protein
LKLETKTRVHVEKCKAVFNESLNFGFDLLADRKVLLTIYGINETNTLRSIGTCTVNLKTYCKDVTARKNALQKLTLKVQNCTDKNTYIEVWLNISVKDSRKEQAVISARGQSNRKLTIQERGGPLGTNNFQSKIRRTRKNSIYDSQKTIPLKNITIDCNETKESGLIDNVSEYAKENYCSSAVHKRASTSLIVPGKSKTEFQKLNTPHLKSLGNVLDFHLNIQDIEAKLFEQTNTMKEQEKKIVEKEGEVKRLETLLTTRKAEIAVLRKKLEATENSKVKELEEQLTKLKEKNNTLQVTIARLNNEQEELIKAKSMTTSKSFKELPWKSQYLDSTMNEMLSPECIPKDNIMHSFSCDHFSSSESMISIFTRAEQDNGYSNEANKMTKEYIRLFITGFNEQVLTFIKRLQSHLEITENKISNTLKRITLGNKNTSLGSPRSHNNQFESEIIKLREENINLVQNQFSLIKTIELLKLRITELEQCPAAAAIAGLRDQNKKRTKNLKRCIQEYRKLQGELKAANEDRTRLHKILNELKVPTAEHYSNRTYTPDINNVYHNI